MKDDLSTLVQELHAREQIKELRARYGWHAARGEHAGIVALFAADAVFEFLADETTRQRLIGHDQIRAFLVASMFPGLVFPMIHNDIVKVSGDEAVGTCMMESRSARQDAPVFGGYYHDRMRRIDGRWLFTERRYFRYYPQFERSGLDEIGQPEAGLALDYHRAREVKTT